jgi:hypothetical protein
MCRFRWLTVKGGGSSVAKRLPASHSSAASFVDKGSSLTLVLFLARKMHAIHKRIIGLQ